ncbi:MAG: hypothetical protein AAF170_03165 [Bacteroidota bacterium]
MTDSEIQSYLHFGAAYRPLAEQGSHALANIHEPGLREWIASASRSALIAEGVRRLRASAEAALEAAEPGSHAIQLSGGYDSRAILGALLNHLSPSEVVACTFGTPGAPDYELPARMAASVGVAIERLDIQTLRWDLDAVVAYARNAFRRHPAALALERYVNYQLRCRIGTAPTYWVGYLGDALAGAHLPQTPSESWEAAAQRFVATNRRTRSILLTRPGWSPTSVLPDAPLMPHDVLGFDDQLDLAGRQAAYIDIPWAPFRDTYLFDQREWKAFALALPWEERVGPPHRRLPLYLDVLAEAFPRLSRFPVQGNRPRPIPFSPVQAFFQRAGRAARRVGRALSVVPRTPDVMRMDYAADLRADTPHARLVRQLVADSDARGRLPHLDGRALWEAHARNEADYARELMVLASLEVNLKAGENHQRIRRSQVRELASA